MKNNDELANKYKKETNRLKKRVSELRTSEFFLQGMMSLYKNAFEKEEIKVKDLEKKIEELSVNFLGEKEILRNDFLNAERRYIRAESIVRSLSKSLSNSSDAIQIMTKG
jgi:hypothetical protein